MRKADELIARIEKGVEQLENAGRKGRQLEVAMWLWNMSRLDQDLERAVETLEEETREDWETIYADRNEALLFVAENIRSIFNDYAESLQKGIRNRTTISLVKCFVEKVVENSSI